MSPGKFITLEGGEGAGKSTQALLLGEALRVRGVEVVLTREPGGTPGAEAIRDLLLHGASVSWLPRAEALLFAAARSDHVEKLIRPALAEGKWVICDRFLDSSRAYQGGEGNLDDEDIMALHAIGSAGLMPDRTLLIEVAPEVAAQRASKRDGEFLDTIAGRGDNFHGRVASRFAELAARDADRCIRIDGNGDADETHALIMAALTPLLELQT